MAFASSVEEFEEVSTLTDKGQTTVPKSVRKALGLSAGDRIAFHVGEAGVSLRRADDASDPAIGMFLSFLARDIERHPENLKAFPPELKKRLARLVEGVPVDLESAIEDDVDL
jgi:antitoxin PrlF